MLPLLYEASPDNQLPILVETVGGKNSVVSFDNVEKSISKKVSVFQDSLINDLLDDLRDLWILVLLVDLPQHNPEAFATFFKSLDEYSYSETISRLLLAKYIPDIALWNHFSKKHPDIFARGRFYGALHSRSLYDYFTQSSFAGLSSLYHGKLHHFRRSVPLILGHVRSMTDSEAKTIMSLKLAAFFYVATHFVGESTALGSTVRQKDFADAVSMAEDTIMRYCSRKS